ncbi:MAG: aldolase/citrate lyase family protein, partial [Acetobacterales bacterium]
PVLAVDVGFAAPGLVELLGRLGADAALVDCAHGPVGIETLENMARAARLTGLPLIARIPSPDAPTVERHLLRGIDGMLVPRLNTADQARQVLDTVRALMPKRQAEKLLIVQIASARAVAELDRFLDIDGIDAFFVSPLELATSLGHEGNWRHPEIQQVIDDILAAIRASGRTPGIVVDRTNLQPYVRKGAAFLYTHLAGLLATGLRDMSAQLRQSEETTPAPRPTASNVAEMPKPAPAREVATPQAAAQQEPLPDPEPPYMDPPEPDVPDFGEAGFVSSFSNPSSDRPRTPATPRPATARD